MSFFEFPHTRTYDSDLGWLIKNAKTVDEAIALIKQWIETTQPTIDNIKSLYDEIMAGNLPPAVQAGIKEWMEKNALNLVGDLVKMVFFGITDDGYFIAYIPESWDDIIFSTTGLDITIAGEDYGKLVLSY